MLCSCIVTKLKNTFDSLVCEFTANVVKGGIVSRCRCNIFTIGNRSTDTAYYFIYNATIILTDQWFELYKTNLTPYDLGQIDTSIFDEEIEYIEDSMAEYAEMLDSVDL